LRGWVARGITSWMFGGLLLLQPGPVDAANESAPAQCPRGELAATSPALVDLAALEDALRTLTQADGTPVLQWNDALMADLKRTFDPQHTKSKMEQFYRLLHLIQAGSRNGGRAMVGFDPVGARKILLTSGVFSDPSVPSRIQGISAHLLSDNSARFEVTYAEKGIEVPLNKGAGFFLFRNGKCQHARSIVFDRAFSFETTINGKKNLVVSGFRGVDLFGDFGNRGIIDLDIQYVALRVVEFYAGTNLGRVTAHVSREEFAKNKHNVLLELVTRFLPDHSVQPIDW